MPAFPKKWLWVLLALAFVVPLLQPLFPDVVSDYRLFLVSTMIIAAIAVLGLNLLTGFNGQISLGHGAFYAVGAYTAAVLMDHLNMPYWATLPCAAIVCFIVGYLFGLPALKLEGHYLALATFALALAVPQILKYKWLEGLTGGVQGIVLSKPEVPFGLPLNEDQWLYYYCLVVMVALYWAAANILNSRSGRAMMAIRDQYMAADTMGIDTALYKTVTFGISAAYTGIAGALSASAIAFVAPDSFNFFLSIKFLIGLVVGGIGSLAGSVVGGIFYVLVDNSAQALSTFVKNDLGLQFDLSAYTVFGILLIVLMYLMPMGIVGGVYLAVRRLRGRAQLGGIFSACRPCNCRGRGLQHNRSAEGRLLSAFVFAEFQKKLTAPFSTGRSSLNTSRRAFVGGASALALLSGSRAAFAQKKYDDGATDTEIKIGHYRPLQRAGVRLRRDRQGHRSLLEERQRRRRHQRPQDQLHHARRRLQPAQDRRDGPPARRAGQGALPVQHAGHAVQHGDPQVHEPEEGAAALRRDRRLEVGQAQGVPVDHGLPARLPHRSRHLRQAHPGQRQGRQDRRADAERRLRQGLLRRLQGRPRQGRRQASSSTSPTR